MNNRLKFVIPVLIVAAIAFALTRGETTDAGSLAASGTVEATTADLGFQLPGRLEQLAVAEGDVVQTGQSLARLDTRELEAVISAARAQVLAAEARLDEMRSGARPQELAGADAATRAATERATNARRELERAQTLFAGGAVSRQLLDQAATALEVAEATLDQAEQARGIVAEGPRDETLRAQAALVEQARANVLRSEATLSNAHVVAPFPGVVTIRHREPGEIVPAGAPVVTLLNPADRWVRIYVREDEIGRVQIGQTASIVSDTYPDRTYSGEVVFVGSEAEFTPRNVQTAEERIKLVYPVKVRITGDDGFELKPGIPADVTLDEAGR